MTEWFINKAPTFFYQNVTFVECNSGGMKQNEACGNDLLPPTSNLVLLALCQLEVELSFVFLNYSFLWCFRI